MLFFNLDELRERGYSEEDYTDEELLVACEKILEIISLFTNQNFRLNNLTLKLDGQGVPELFLPLPIIGVTSITEEDGGLVDSGDYVVYNREIPDDKQNPKIIKTFGNFPKGNQNISVTGIFGFVDGTIPPSPILEVTYRLLPKALEPLLEGGSDIEVAMSPDSIKKETTDRWSFERFNREQIGSLFGNYETAILMKFSRGDDILFGGWV